MLAAETLRSWLVDGDELAVLDAREEGVFFDEHLFHAACLPLSRVELELARLVPRRDVRVVWCDDGSSELAHRAAITSSGLGWTNVHVLDGGIPAWGAAGGELYSGVNVPSKAFGEYVEHTFDTPRIPASELVSMLDQGANVVVLDSRPVEEYHRMTIPTSIDCPGAELVHRAIGMAPDPDTLVIVNCAGRTRSIIGAQSLINAGLPNDVVALENGTMGWELAGYEVERGQTRYADEPSDSTEHWAIGAANDVAVRFGVEAIDVDTLDAWLADTTRTTYMLDVRTPEEFEAGHRPGSRWAPGGQLVQATDEYVGIRNARLVLIDDNGVRATMTASWLRQLGWADAVVLDDGLDGDLETGVAPSLAVVPDSREISVADLAATLGNDGTIVLDLATSLDHRDKGHIPGSFWAVRSRFDEAASFVDAAGITASTVVIASFDDGLARCAADDAGHGWPDARVLVLAGGTRAWIAAGHDVEHGLTHATTANNDVWYKPYDVKGDNPPQEAMEAYLTWEVALVDQLARDNTVVFPDF
jgi:rhodanese-related sulfurtransferase